MKISLLFLCHMTRFSHLITYTYAYAYLDFVIDMCHNRIYLVGTTEEESVHGNDVDDSLVASFDVLVFQATFYDIVKEFWYSKAHAM
jgi:hypothetical protein